MRPTSVAKRTAIIEAAATIFVRDGFDPASMDAIAEAAGVSKQTLYSHFGNKEGLFAGVLEAETARAFGSLPIAADAADTLTAATLPRFLTELGLALLDVVLAPRMVGLRRLAIAESHRFAASAQAFARGGHARSVTALAAVFARLSERGVMSGDPEGAAITFVQLAVVRSADRAMFGIEESGDRRSLVDEAVRVVLAAWPPGPREDSW